MNANAPAQQSDFVTALAWILLAFNAFGVVAALMQNVMLNLFMPAMLAATPQGVQAPPFPLTPFRVFGLLLLGLSAFMTYAAYALLKRRDWARRTFVVVFALGIAWIILCAVLFGLGFGLADFSAAGQGPMPPEMRTMMHAMMWVFGIFGLAMAALFFWLIKRLRSPAIKAEFRPAGPVTSQNQ